jgi:Na+-transporting NADH:ubiquinone oxidoreductase subunit NqrB
MALVLVATGLFFVWQAALLPFGRVGLPGPGFFPFALGIALALLALALLYGARQEGQDEAAVFLGHRNVLITLVALAGVAFAFERLGAYPTLGAFTAAMLLIVARTAAWRALLGAVVGMVIVWLFFGLALGVRLPDGTLWEQLADLTAAAPVSAQP